MYVLKGDTEKIIELAKNDEYGEKIFLSSAQEATSTGSYDIAMKLLESALTLYPSSYASVNNLAVLYRKMGEESKIDSVLNLFKEYNRDNDQLVAQANQLIERMKRLSPSGEGSG
jgi:tetratricopeptide (TPR) repeat protein